MHHPTQYDRLAAITIQGGGLFGLSLLGQLDAVHKHGIKPVAIAGTSAGAIVAALYWAGLTPQQIKDEVCRLADCAAKHSRVGTGLTDFLGEFEPKHRPFDFASFRSLQSKLMTTVVDPLRGHLKVGGEGSRSIMAACSEWADWWGQCICRPDKVLARIAHLFSLYSHVRTHVRNRGLFPGQVLEREVDRLLRLSPYLQAYPDDVPTGRFLTFKDFRELARKRKTEGVYFPPLILTGTNVTQRRLDLFTSMDERDENIPVARAVRASAGYPVAFRPVDIPQGPGGDWYVDGGVISNFPAWVFSHEFRRRLSSHPDYEAFAARPWVHIGLRLLNDTRPTGDPTSAESFFKSMTSLVVGGGARNDLETRAADLISRSITIQQPLSDTEGPENMLDFDRMRRRQVEAMFNRGERFASGKLQGVTFDLPVQDRIVPYLQELIEQARCVFENDGQDFKFRSNIFIPQGENLVLAYQVGMGGNSDANLVLRFDQGLTGECFRRRLPQLCNLEMFAARVAGKEGGQLYGFDEAKQAEIRDDRTWLASVPIFDPYAAYPLVLSGKSILTPHVAGQTVRCPGTLDGALFGVLNLDAALPYEDIALDNDAEENQWNDPRIQGIVRIMRSVASEVARVFSDTFAATREGVGHG